MADPFGVNIVALLAGLNVALFAGWAYTLWRWRQTMDAMHVSHFWWWWWVETAVRHRIRLGEDDIEAATELMPDGSPTVEAQIDQVTDQPARHVPAAEAADE